VAKPGQIVTVVRRAKSGMGVRDSAPVGSLYSGVAIDEQGTLYVSDEDIPEVISVTPGGVLKHVVKPFEPFEAPPAATYADLGSAATIVLDRAGTLYIGDQGHSVVRAVSRSGRRYIAAGSGIFGNFAPVDGPARDVKLSAPGDLAVDRAGNLYINEGGSIAKLGPDGIVHTIAGTGKRGFSGDGGPATAATFDSIAGIAFDERSGSLYVVDAHRIRRIDAKGIIDTIAGTGQDGLAPDGAVARQAAFGILRGLVVDSGGTLFVADLGNSVVQSITPDGLVHLVAGTGRQGFAGDGGPASAALLDHPGALTIDNAGNLYVADGGNRVRMIGAQRRP